MHGRDAAVLDDAAEIGHAGAMEYAVDNAETCMCRRNRRRQRGGVGNVASACKNLDALSFEFGDERAVDMAPQQHEACAVTRGEIARNARTHAAERAGDQVAVLPAQATTARFRRGEPDRL